MTTNSAMSGGFLVILGAVLALSAMYLFNHGDFGSTERHDINIHADLPDFMKEPDKK